MRSQIRRCSRIAGTTWSHWWHCIRPLCMRCTNFVRKHSSYQLPRCDKHFRVSNWRYVKPGILSTHRPGHKRQPVGPAFSPALFVEYFPASHGEHVFAATKRSVWLPAPHVVQSLCPSALVVPAGHNRQSVGPVFPPALFVEFCPASVVEYFPASHVRHDVEPFVALYSPASQGAQEVCP